MHIYPTHHRALRIEAQVEAGREELCVVAEEKRTSPATFATTTAAKSCTTTPMTNSSGPTSRPNPSSPKVKAEHVKWLPKVNAPDSPRSH
jgi:hypothetical protein